METVTARVPQRSTRTSAAPPRAPVRRRRLWPAMSWTIVGLVLLVAFLGGTKFLQIHKMLSTPMQMPATTVSSVVVEKQNWAPTLSSVGSIAPVEGTMVAAEYAGVVSQIGFQNGAMAKKGDLLLQLDASAETAQLNSAEADLELAKNDLDRATDLAKRKVISTAELDSAQSKFHQKNAIADQMRSIITKKTIRAPFDGQLGIRQTNVGQMINAGQEVVALTSLDPVFVNFSVPQQRLSDLRQGLEVRVQTDAFPGKDYEGKVTAINSMVDQATRNVQVQATLANPSHTLRPGIFAKVQVLLPTKGPALVVPGTAVAYAPFGDSVFVIEKKKDEKTGKESQVIRQQFVRVGEARGDFVAITEGLKAGETIVSSGVFKLRNSMPVVIDNKLAPKAQLNPKPADT